MDIKKLREIIEVIKEDFGAGLLATDIYAVADSQSIAGFNSNAKACALFNRVTSGIESSLKGAGFPGLNGFYIMDLHDDKMVVVVPMGDYQWGMLLDKNNIQLGLLLNVILPKVQDAFRDALSK